MGRQIFQAIGGFLISRSALIHPLTFKLTFDIPWYILCPMRQTCEDSPLTPSPYDRIRIALRYFNDTRRCLLKSQPNIVLRRCLIVILLLVLSLVVLSCGDDDGKEKGEIRDPFARKATLAPSEQPAAEAMQPTSPPVQPPSSGESTTQQQAPAGTSASLTDLDSYRMRLTMRSPTADGSGWGPDETMEMEWVRESQASRVVMHDPSGSTAMEVITIGDTTWINMGGDWMQTESSPGAQGAAPSADMESLLQGLQGDMTLVGEETVNGVHCKHYTVDTEFSIELPSPSGGVQTVTGHVKGDIWQADQSGLPSIVIRSQTETEMTLFGDTPMIVSEERDVYDINSSAVTIQAPTAVADVLEPPPPSENPPPTPPVEPPSAPLEVADLQDLNSYRLSVTSRVQSADIPAVEVVLTEEWIREPPARRLIVSLGQGAPEMEYIIIGDSAWMNLGGTWMSIPASDVDDFDGGLSSFMTPDSGMTLVGEETVNGVHCKHYVLDLELPSQSVHHEMWVADEAGTPPIVIRAMYRLEMITGDTTMVTEGEVNVTDVNASFSIDPPQ